MNTYNQFSIEAEGSNFHQHGMANLDFWFPSTQKETKITYRFLPHFHPYVGEFLRRLNRGELPDLLKIETQQLRDESYFNTYYSGDPNHRQTIDVKPAIKEVEFSVRGAYSIYNWELFFHIPLAIADQLSANQRFAEAQKWYHFIFNPITDAPVDPASPVARYWNFLKFREQSDPNLITELLEDLAEGSDSEEIQDLKKSIQEWKKTPFSPHEVAKFRPLAYQFNVVMKYLDNLIAWGDSLFRQFTIESINEASQLYILAANILGDKPQEIPRLHRRPVRTYRQLKGQLDEFSNALVEMENEFPLNANQTSGGGSSATQSLYGTTRQLYFCIPPNRKLLGYWDLVADRLFKIRHCMDIEGNVRPLPLFQPPIDPGMLVKAAAAGISLDSIIGGLNQPASIVRYPLLLQRAQELANEVKALGNALLSAIEKGDAERLTLIRQEHERNILTLSKDVKFLQWKEAEANTEALVASREVVFQRFRYYQQLLSLEKFEGQADLSLTRPKMTEKNFEDVYEELVERYGQEVVMEDYREDRHGVMDIAVDVASAVTGAIADLTGAEDTQAHYALNVGENLELNVFGPFASYSKIAAMITRSVIAPVLGLIPQFNVHGTPLGVGGAAEFGGEQLSKGAEYLSDGLNFLADFAEKQGAATLKLAGYQRRVQEWILQNNLAAKDLEQMGRQLIAALIREQIAKRELDTHEVQIEQAQAVETFLREQKFSNEDLYLWMQGELSRVYYECYQLAFDTAKKAESTMKFELMRPELESRDFVRFNYWDSGHKGLLSGEALSLDLKRMELAGLEANKREFELTKHLSLRQFNPLALLQLKTQGFCTIDVPEWLFDLDCPGHYLRRIKSVAVSIPAVSGPYSSINCTLTLQKSSLRRSSVVGDQYNRMEEDDRFVDYFGATQSIVTSRAQQDSGLFELNMRDERFLPFENAGVISTWRLSLPTDLRQFNYDTISDVILHINYTARQGGALLGDAATTYIRDEVLPIGNQSGMAQLFSLKQDFPNEWHQAQTSSSHFQATIQKVHFPYLAQAFDVLVQNIQVWSSDGTALTPLPAAAIVAPANLGTDFNDTLADEDSAMLELDLSSVAATDQVFVIMPYLLD